MGKEAFWTKQPGFALYTTYTIIKALIQLPCLMILYTVPHFRPLREWTFQQAFARAMTRLIFDYASIVELSIPPSLEQGKEGDRFVIIAPPDDDGTQSIYRGVASPNSEPNPSLPSTSTPRPVPIGGTWFPSPFHTHHRQPSSSSSSSKVFLHFHGGAYVLFDSRDRDMGFGARLLLDASPAGSAVLCPQYRLASAARPHHRFPAALQDAITAYAHLVLRLRVPPRDVVLSGDSAGGNLALALLRYLCEAPRGHRLPRPGGVLLWSPWTDLSVRPETLAAREEDRFDLVPPRLAAWALRVFLPEKVGGGQEGGNVCEDPYISPVKKGIVTEVPIWVQWGGREIIKQDIRRFVDVQKQAGARLGTFEIPNAPHDMFMAGEGLGFVKECKEAARHAIRFLDGK
ncbi:Alpha/beta hydrolase fold-3 domain-containing protein [Madurella fahalii]|uniref:Alpha/beta hydrolase fold-3 domain-containing protein n=1 Tax=Madurella fahalii TaxID=1157608 RepID=A0ABQ0GAF4_9PEZI